MNVGLNTRYCLLTEQKTRRKITLKNNKKLSLKEKIKTQNTLTQTHMFAFCILFSTLPMLTHWRQATSTSVIVN